MTVKELTRKLRGKYDKYEVYNCEFKKSKPFTMLGKDFYGKEGKGFTRVLNTKEVKDYKIDTIKSVSISFSELVSGKELQWKDVRVLKLYIEV